MLYTFTDRNIAFSGTRDTCYLFSFGNLVVDAVHFLLTENIHDNYIILFHLNYNRRWMNVIFLQDKHNINAVSLCIWGKDL